ncbi:MAG: MBL fold metallo-hydrolase [Anaerocolumna sp.]
MLNYFKTEITKGFYCIEQHFVRCFLVVGVKEALLIDTGVGGNLREYIAAITKLPITVIMTHADQDHV